MTTQNKEIRKLLLYINDTPKLQSLLYDMDLLPEQCEHGSRDWRNMLLLAERWKNSRDLSAHDQLLAEALKKWTDYAVNRDTSALISSTREALAQWEGGKQ